MRKKNYLAKAFLGACAVAMMVSCTKSKDLYDPLALKEKEEIEQLINNIDVEKQYNEDFIAKYGPIDPGQTWDFTTGAKLGTRAYTIVKAEKVSGLDFGITGNNQVTKNKKVYETINDILPDKVKHEGKPVTLVAPANSFYIFPISARGQFTHRMVVNLDPRQNGIVLCDKTWTNYDKNYVNGMNAGGTQVKMEGLYVEAPVGTPIHIYLAQVNGGHSTNYGTPDGRAIYINVPDGLKLELPNGITVSENAEIKYVGIEDGDDNDYNDAVIAIVGNPDVPAETIITNDEYVVNTNITKRYLVEDLGTRGDFDFNDIVVDVTQNTAETHKVTYENGILKTDDVEKIEKSEKAAIRALGGTLNFTLKIGNTKWTKSGGRFDVGTMYNTTKGFIDYNAKLAEFEVSGWNTDNKNISVDVEGDKNRGSWYILFPEPGKVPKVIAVDPDRKWNNENESLNSFW